MKTLACSILGAVLALGWATSHAESGPKPPVEIRDSTDAWALDVDLDRKRYLSAFVTRVLLDSSHELGRELEEVAIDRAAPRDAGRATLQLAIERGALAQAPDGVYVQRVYIDAIPFAVTDSIYRTQRALYFRVAGGTIERIGIREYSAAADPVHYEHDASGREIAVHAGGAVLDAQPHAAASVRYAIPLAE